MLVNMERILFATDFSEPARHAQQYAVSLAEQFGAELHVLHVIPSTPMPLPDAATPWVVPEPAITPQIDEARIRMTHDLGDDCSTDFLVVQKVVIGYAVDEIVGYAKEHAIDLIVIGTHGHTGLSHLLLGSVAETIVRLSECPVMTVHPKDHRHTQNVVHEHATVA